MHTKKCGFFCFCKRLKLQSATYEQADSYMHFGSMFAGVCELGMNLHEDVSHLNWKKGKNNH